MKILCCRTRSYEFLPSIFCTMSIGSGSKEANDRNAEEKMMFVDDTKEFRDCSMSVLHDSIWEK